MKLAGVVVLAGFAASCAGASPSASPRPDLQVGYRGQGAGAGRDAQDAIDALVGAEMARDRVAAVSLAVLRHGQIAKLAAYGTENLETQTAASLDTAYEIGSMAKMFTAAAVLRLVALGKLGLDDPIGRYLDGAPASWSNVRLRHLLDHTSGLPDYQGFGIDPATDHTLRELIARVASEPLDFPAGESFSYSNTGYIVLGAVIERVTAKTYREAMAELVLAPLGMTATAINDLEAIVPHRARGYVHDGDQLRNGPPISPSMAATPDGGIVTTIRDLVRWDQAMTEGKLLTPADWQRMQSVTRLDTGAVVRYGFGWFVRVLEGRRAVEHAGNQEAFNADIYRDLTAGTTVIALTNVDGRSAAVLVHRIVQDALPEARPARGTAAAPGEAAAAAIRRFVDGWLAGTFERELASRGFALAMQSARNRARLARAGRIGKLARWAHEESIACEGGVAHVFRLVTDVHEYTVTATVLRDGAIDEIAFDPR